MTASQSPVQLRDLRVPDGAFRDVLDYYSVSQVRTRLSKLRSQVHDDFNNELAGGLRA